VAQFADDPKKGLNVKSVFLFSVLGVLSINSNAAYATTSEEFRVDNSSKNSPESLNSTEKQQFTAIFASIRDKKWDQVEALLAKAPKSAMTNMAKAEYYLAPGSPQIAADKLQSLINSAPYLFQGDRLDNLAKRRGVTDLAFRPEVRRMSWLGEAPRRTRPEPVAAEGISGLRDEIQVFVRNDDSRSAEARYRSAEASLSTAARAELLYRIAWSYHTENDFASSRRMAGEGRGLGGQWADQSEWVYGLIAWQKRDFAAALQSFESLASRTADSELKATAFYWASRAATSAKQPQKVGKLLKSASKITESFYGQLAIEALGENNPATAIAPSTQALSSSLKSESNVQIAIGLAQIGQLDLADQVLRYQARIGDSDKHGDLARLAGSLNLPSTQYWMAHYGPSRDSADIGTRYPRPNWQPQGGWRVDPSLVFAHTLQESAFKTNVVSGAGARGLMQVRPGTAQEMARQRGAYMTAADLDRPSVNLEYGQSYLEKLRDMGATGGMLPKVIAAYNAGPAPVTRWNSQIQDGGDPLLYIESIPYWETRGYVPTVLRNFWLYEAQIKKGSISKSGLVQNMWPGFPDQNGKVNLIRVNGNIGK
jgi:soluble lytic murein transglycosylase